MSVFEDKLKKFEAVVVKEATKKKQKYLEEIDQYKEEELARADNAVLNQAYTLIQQKIAEIKAENMRRISKKELALRQDLLAVRSELMRSVFDGVATKLGAFTESPDYPRYLADGVRKAVASGGTALWTICVREKDLVFADALKKAAGFPCKVEAAQDIQLGGFKLLCYEKGVVIDESFDSLLADERAYFRRSSGLSIM